MSVSLIVSALLLIGPAQAESGPRYNRDVRPILADTCFACHGPDSAARKADLRLDRRQAAVDYGAIVPGDPEQSSLITRIFAESAEERMPPPSSHKSLTKEQKELLRQWVANGAEYEPHWSLIAPERPAVPAVAKHDWVRNPIDAFILAKLEASGLTPAPEADRRTLARRVALDLTGLPPDPQMVEEFVVDPAPDAYERLVDRLLKSKRWGEHRGRYWLDAARYADTHGIHFDNYREMWSYRDWVINAFNRNMPFDQFTIEQLAGDLLPNPSLEQLVATGFNRCNITTNEGGIIDEEYLVLYTRDRTETTSTVWLGLTANCAVCHDHKFDPLTQREFYEMAAFFNNTTQRAKDGNIKDTPPIVPVPLDEDRDRFETLQTELAGVRQSLDRRRTEARSEFDQWAAGDAKAAVTQCLPSQNLVLHIPLSPNDIDKITGTLGGSVVEWTPPVGTKWQPGHVADRALQFPESTSLQVDAAGDFASDQPFSCNVWVKLSGASSTGAVVARMDDKQGYRGWDLWVEGNRVGSHIIHRWQDDAIKVVSNNPLKANTWHHVLLTYDGSAKAAGVRIYVDGELQQTRTMVDSLKGSIRVPTIPLTIAQRGYGSQLAGVTMQDLRIYDMQLSPEDAGRLSSSTRAAWLADKPADKRTPAETNELFDWWLRHLDEPFKNQTAKLNGLEAERQAIAARGTVAHVMNEADEAAMAYVLYRGEYTQRREEVKPTTPTMLPPMPEELPRDRLGFAKWLLRPEHPLTARVTVNRYWQQVFGTGIVATAGDFGITGDLPSHPELLDWLAVEFRESGWDVKRFFKLLVTSSTYRQSAVTTQAKLEADPDNRLLSRGPRFRMDAEMIRDHALSVSGLLSDKIGGPSVKPYQPVGVWEAVAMPESNTRNYVPDDGENLYRRSLYTFWKRAAPPASMEIFNAPNRETCTVQRERTNTPLQALVTLNDPQFVEAARHLAQQALKANGGCDRDRLDFIAARLLARPFRPEELSVVTGSLDALLAHYQAHPEDAKQLLEVGESAFDMSLDPATLAGWTMLCNQLMNLDEVLNK